MALMIKKMKKQHILVLTLQPVATGMLRKVPLWDNETERYVLNVSLAHSDDLRTPAQQDNYEPGEFCGHLCEEDSRWAGIELLPEPAQQAASAGEPPQGSANEEF